MTKDQENDDALKILITNILQNYLNSKNMEGETNE